jgi:hypothetical protein
MSSPEQQTAQLLAILARLIRQLTARDVRDILEGRARLELVVQRPEGNLANGAPKGTPAAAPIDDAVVAELLTFTSREEGLAFLRKLLRTRKALEALARYIDIPVSKMDNMARIRDKIVEGTIGYRLRSESVRNAEL